MMLLLLSEKLLPIASNENNSHHIYLLVIDGWFISKCSLFVIFSSIMLVTWMAGMLWCHWYYLPMSGISANRLVEYFVRS